jgi:predicted nucleic acid-binding protein
VNRVFVDTNVLLRFLTQDDARQSERAERLFVEGAAGRVILVTGPPVLFELVWTLRRAYKVPRERTLDLLSSLLAWDGLELVDRALAEAAVERARGTGQEYADAYIVVSAEAAGAATIATFNERDFRALGAGVHAW